MKLTIDRFKQAEEFIEEHARELEKTYFRFLFKKGSEHDVLNELENFQNQDGGFGHGIEPDFFLPDSSVMATTVAFQYFSKLKVTSQEPLVQHGINYLLLQYKDKEKRWPSVPPEVNQYPHAPWWHFNEEGNGNDVEQFWGNPSAEVISYLYEYEKLVAKEFLVERINDALERIANTKHIEFHEAMCYLRLADVLEEEKAKRIFSKIGEHLHEIIDWDEESWKGYGCQPYHLIDSKVSPYYEENKEKVDKSLDFLIQSQHKDGYWEPNWSREFEGDDQAWKKAKTEWRGILTIGQLDLLNRFGRIDKN
ncbi:hypothetical protein [Metabacillus arenae]|uniref:Prenyltransferase n=1 Tax=Metabacillus arenae TaxID=2771434 RepID=A0A926NGT1_9BACI|nr:hypothetical protein [Metabacillus arenae]MBD1379748.1 hypothetical protein [Metabacillus arenae]